MKTWLKVGMIGAQDDLSTPDGLVVIEVADESITVASYAIPGTGVGKWEPSVRGIRQLTFGVDTMPRVTGLCDRPVAKAISEWLQERGMGDFDGWKEYTQGGWDRGQFGPDYLERTRNRRV